MGVMADRSFGRFTAEGRARPRHLARRMGIHGIPADTDGQVALGRTHPASVDMETLAPDLNAQSGAARYSVDAFIERRVSGYWIVDVGNRAEPHGPVGRTASASAIATD